MCSDCNMLRFESRNPNRTCFQCKKERQRLYNLSHKEDRQKRIKKQKLQDKLNFIKLWKHSNSLQNLAHFGH